MIRSMGGWGFLFLVAAVCARGQNVPVRIEGEVSRGMEFRRDMGPGLVLVLQPAETGWMIAVVPKTKCVEPDDWAAVVNAPYRNYNALHVDSSYGITASEAVKINPREFFFVQSCEEYKEERRRLDIVLWPYNYSKAEEEEALAKLGTSRLGRAKLTIVEAKVSTAGKEIEGKNYGRVEWLKFRVEVSRSTVGDGEGK